MKAFKSEDISIVLNFLDKHLLNYEAAESFLDVGEIENVRPHIMGAMIQYKTIKKNYAIMNSWLAKYLSKEQIRKLRALINQKRWKQRNQVKNITLRKDLYYLIAEYADNHKITLDEALTRAFVILNENDNFEFSSQSHLDIL